MVIFVVKDKRSGIGGCSLRRKRAGSIWCGASLSVRNTGRLVAKKGEINEDKILQLMPIIGCYVPIGIQACRLLENRR